MMLKEMTFCWTTKITVIQKNDQSITLMITIMIYWPHIKVIKKL